MYLMGKECLAQVHSVAKNVTKNAELNYTLDLLLGTEYNTM